MPASNLVRLETLLSRITEPALDRVRRTPFARSIAEETASMESYATMLRGLSEVTIALERALSESPGQARLLRSGLSRRHAMRRDLSVVGPFARAVSPSSRAWLTRVDTLVRGRRYALVGHSWVLHAALPVGGRDNVRHLGVCTGLTASRGLESLAVSGRDDRFALAAWCRAAEHLATTSEERHGIVAEAVLAASLLEGLSLETERPPVERRAQERQERTDGRTVGASQPRAGGRA